MKLVMNADDFGLTEGVTKGILEACEKGIVRSTTALINSAYIEEAYELSKKYPQLGIGIHLNLTLGKPLTDVKTLVDENGNFFRGAAKVYSHEVDYDEIYREWKAQIEKFVQVFHRLPTHIDSHHHVHDYTEEALEVTKRLAEEYGLQIRRYSQFEFVRGFYGDDISREILIGLLEKNKDKCIEIMCHPGYVDLDLYRKSSYNLNRVKELDVICSDEVVAYCKEHDVELVNYGAF